jgi:hypothetical protein
MSECQIRKSILSASLVNQIDAEVQRENLEERATGKLRDPAQMPCATCLHVQGFATS